MLKVNATAGYKDRLPANIWWPANNWKSVPYIAYFFRHALVSCLHFNVLTKNICVQLMANKLALSRAKIFAVSQSVKDTGHLFIYLDFPNHYWLLNHVFMNRSLLRYVYWWSPCFGGDQTRHCAKCGWTHKKMLEKTGKLNRSTWNYFIHLYKERRYK